jgi:hypothetical protein
MRPSECQSMISQAPPASPLPLAILALSVVGAIQDFRYRRKGGTPPSKRDRILFGSVLLVIVLAYFRGLIARLLPCNLRVYYTGTGDSSIRSLGTRTLANET